jgi:hypothetical protein
MGSDMCKVGIYYAWYLSVCLASEMELGRERYFLIMMKTRPLVHFHLLAFLLLLHFGVSLLCDEYMYPVVDRFGLVMLSALAKLGCLPISLLPDLPLFSPLPERSIT